MVSELFDILAWLSGIFIYNGQPNYRTIFTFIALSALFLLFSSNLRKKRIPETLYALLIIILALIFGGVFYGIVISSSEIVYKVFINSLESFISPDKDITFYNFVYNFLFESSFRILTAFFAISSLILIFFEYNEFKTWIDEISNRYKYLRYRYLIWYFIFLPLIISFVFLTYRYIKVSLIVILVISLFLYYKKKTVQFSLRTYLSTRMPKEILIYIIITFVLSTFLGLHLLNTINKKFVLKPLYITYYNVTGYSYRERTTFDIYVTNSKIDDVVFRNDLRYSFSELAIEFETKKLINTEILKNDYVVICTPVISIVKEIFSNRKYKTEIKFERLSFSPEKYTPVDYATICAVFKLKNEDDKKELYSTLSDDKVRYSLVNKAIPKIRYKLSNNHLKIIYNFNMTPIVRIANKLDQFYRKYVINIISPYPYFDMTNKTVIITLNSTIGIIKDNKRHKFPIKYVFKCKFSSSRSFKCEKTYKYSKKPIYDFTVDIYTHLYKNYYGDIEINLYYGDLIYRIRKFVKNQTDWHNTLIFDNITVTLTFQ